MDRIGTLSDRLAEPPSSAPTSARAARSVTSYIGKEDVTRRSRARHTCAERSTSTSSISTSWLKRERIAHAAEDTLDYARPTVDEGAAALITRTSTQPASRSPARTRRARFKGSTPHAPAAIFLPYLPDTGEV